MGSVCWPLLAILFLRTLLVVTCLASWGRAVSEVCLVLLMKAFPASFANIHKQTVGTVLRHGPAGGGAMKSFM